MERAHKLILRELLAQVQGATRILDAGSGRTSLLELTKAFPSAQIDALVYPGDQRKLSAITELAEGNTNIHILERDICKGLIGVAYDLVVAHLLLGEATKFGNRFDTLLSSLLDIPGGAYIVIDYLEDPNVKEPAIETTCRERGLMIQDQIVMENQDPQVWDDFAGVHNFGYLVQNIYR